ncbi:hypothetical protein [Saccharibacillus qingshengii]|uniref:hypothetical protein n=1 Tax=Saccharibacillus qingshengii TaxID=1763540 RepID=UPI00155286CF|nr:hypothetical protein [Saccharibacillus qingshengii]
MKAIEVQLAVHRAPETSRMQQDQMQRPLTDQALLAGQTNTQVERARHRSAPTTEASDAGIRKDSGGQEGNTSQRNAAGESEEQEAGVAKIAAPHPFKGKHLDLSL